MKTIDWISIISIAFFIGIFSSTCGQDCLWINQAGGSGQDDSGPITTDHNGCIYVSGDFTSSFCYFKTTTLNLHGYNDVFIVKYDPLGNEVWVKQFGKYENYEGAKETISGMVFDSLDQTLLVTGTFYQFLILDDTIIQGQHLDVFVMKLDLDGNILWITTGGCEFEDKSMGIAYDNQGSVYITGVNRYPATFGDTTIPAGGFMAKYDHTGELLWIMNKFHYSTDDVYYSEAPPQYSVYSNDQLIIYGKSLNSVITIDTITLGGFDNGSSFLDAFTMNGNIKWLRKIGGGNDYPNGQISTDPSNNILIAGIFQGTGIFGHDTLYNPSDDYDCFLTKLTQDGVFLWSVQGNATGIGWGSVSLCDNEGNVYTGGLFNDSLTFGEQTLVAQTNNDIFLVSYTPSGICRGAFRFSQGNISSLAIDINGNLVMGGAFSNYLTIDTKTLNSYGLYDAYIAKCFPITSTNESLDNPSNQLLIYANPTTGKCTITIPEEFRHEQELTLYVYESQGRLIQQSAIQRTSETYRLDIQAQASGVYQAVLTDGRRSVSGRIVFNK